ncbi:MAG: hypothetical protein CMK23_05875 [Porticoccaceae bacterium]|nr:hypothetical protein [Porticoccaceae bacterium]
MLKILVNVSDDEAVKDATFGTGYGFYIQLDVDIDGTFLLACLKNERCENWIGTDWLMDITYPVVTWGAEQVQYAVENVTTSQMLEHAYKYLLNEQAKGNLDDPRFTKAA